MTPKKVTRREFVGRGAAAAAGLTALGRVSLSNAAPAASAWVPRMPINPAIDNLRVVSMKDAAMVRQDCPIVNFRSMTVQNAETVVDKERIQGSMDTMAMVLAARDTPAEAWSAIFRKPASKTWGQVRVVIKVNALGDNHPRVACIDKICRVLNGFGVPFANMTVFDAGRNCINLYNSLVGRSDSLGLPAGISVRGAGNNVDDVITIPTVAAGTSISCTQIIASAGPTYNYDIMVNIAVNKGHGQSQNGHATLIMKNHLGTVNINSCPNMNRLYLMNTCDAVVGGDPPRQQLCIVDSLWGQKGGPDGSPGDRIGQGEDPNVYRLIMGTFGPAVDYLTIKKVREPEIHATHNGAVVEQYLTSFGYTSQQQSELLTLSPEPWSPGPGWVDITPQTASRRSAATRADTRAITVHASGPGALSASTVLRVPGVSGRVRLTIHTLRGELVRDLGMPPGDTVLWNGVKESGGMAVAGTYIARAVCDGAMVQGVLALVR